MRKNLLYPLQPIWAFLGSPRLIALAQPEHLFLTLALPFGIIFIFLSAPFQAPDEYAHFYRAYAISTGQFTGLQVMLPQSVLEFSDTVSIDLAGNDQNKQSKKALLQEFSRSFEEQPQVGVSIVSSAIVSPVPYLPQAFGILIGRLAHLQPILIFYLGRIINFLVWMGLIFLAIRITPIHPRIFAALALMPMTLHQAASNSPDAATIAISFLFIAFTLRVLMDQRTKTSLLHWVILSFLIVALALSKSIYILGAGMLFTIPFRRFRQQRVALPLTLLVIGIGLASGLVWLNYSSTFVSVEMMNASKTPTTAGLSYIFQHPQVAAPIIWRSAVTHVGYEMRTFIGVLGWIDTPLPNWVYPLYYALLLFTVIFEPHVAFLYVREKLWIGLLAILSVLVMTAMFFYPEVSVGDGILNSPQGRYFIPLGPLYFLPFSQSKWCIPPDSPTWVVVGLIHLLVLVVSTRAMLWRYYAI